MASRTSTRNFATDLGGAPRGFDVAGELRAGRAQAGAAAHDAARGGRRPRAGRRAVPARGRDSAWRHLPTFTDQSHVQG